jgi:hypothetical protein
MNNMETEIDWKAMDGKYRILTDELPVCSDCYCRVGEHSVEEVVYRFDYDPISQEYDPTSEKVLHGEVQGYLCREAYGDGCYSISPLTPAPEGWVWVQFLDDDNLLIPQEMLMRAVEEDIAEYIGDEEE